MGQKPPADVARELAETVPSIIHEAAGVRVLDKVAAVGRKGQEVYQTVKGYLTPKVAGRKPDVNLPLEGRRAGRKPTSSRSMRKR